MPSTLPPAGPHHHPGAVAAPAVSDVSDDFAVSLLDDSGAEIARVAAHDLQPTKGLLLLAADERRRAGGPAVTIRFCAHFLRDGMCKRRHRCRFAHFAPPTGSQDTSPHHHPGAAASSASTQPPPPPPPLLAAASRLGDADGGGANSAVPSHRSGSRLYGRRGWSHAAYAAVPSRV